MDAPHTIGETPEARRQRLGSILRHYRSERDRHLQWGFAAAAARFDAPIAEIEAALPAADA